MCSTRDRSMMPPRRSWPNGSRRCREWGSSLPSVRVELNPTVLNKYGIGLEQVRTALASANANVPKGHFSDDYRQWEVGANDQIFKAIDYKPLLITYSNGAAVRLSDVGDVID